MKTLAAEEFIKRAKEVHGDKYDYSLVDYKNARTKVKIICPKHGIFEQTPDSHNRRKTGCPKCGHATKKNKGIKDNLETFIKKAKEVHDDKYDYSLVDYKNSQTKVKIICPIHGAFEQTPNCHLSGGGCPKCGVLIKTLTKEQFVEKAKEIHGDKYDYSSTNYINSYTKIKIICPKHGIFEQTPDSHIRQKHGCPKCHSSTGEKAISKWLYARGFIFKEQVSFKDLKDKNPLSYDFYIPSENLLIEYNGEQHYRKSSFGHHDLKIQRHHDWIKRKYAKDNGYKLLTIPYWDYKIIEKVLEENLMNESFSYKIIADVGVLSKNKEAGWTKELKKISWNGKPEVFDIRNWGPLTENGERKMGKGITLTKEELYTLKVLIEGLNLEG